MVADCTLVVGTHDLGNVLIVQIDVRQIAGSLFRQFLMLHG